MSDRDYLCRGCPSGSPWVFLTFSRTRFLIFLPCASRAREFGERGGEQRSAWKGLNLLGGRPVRRKTERVNSKKTGTVLRISLAL